MLAVTRSLLLLVLHLLLLLAKETWSTPLPTLTALARATTGHILTPSTCRTSLFLLTERLLLPVLLMQLLQHHQQSLMLAVTRSHLLLVLLLHRSRVMVR